VYTCYDVYYCRYVLPDAYLPIVLPQLQGEAEVAPTTGTDTARRTDYLELLSQLMRGTAPATLLPHLAAIVAALTGSTSNSSSSSSSTASALPALTAAPTDAVTNGAAAASNSAGIVSAAAEGTEAAVTQTAVSLAAVTLGDSDSPAVRAATLTALHSLLATVCRAGNNNSSSNSTSTTASTTAAAAAAGSAARAAVQAHFLKTGRLATLDVLSRGAVAYALACRAALAPAADSVLRLLAVLGGWQTVGTLVSAHGCALVASCLAAWPSVAAWTLGSQQQAVLSQVLLGFAEGKTGCASQLPGIVAIVEVCYYTIFCLPTHGNINTYAAVHVKLCLQGVPCEV
jgi:hypothetical protein